MVSRRGFVAGLAAVPLAGCSVRAPESDGSEAPNSTGNRVTGVPEERLEPKGPVQGQNDVEIRVRDPAGVSKLEYIVDDEVLARVDWPDIDGERGALHVAGRAARRFVTKKLDGNRQPGLSIGAVPQEGENVPIISNTVILSRDGNHIVNDPLDVEFEHLVALCPATVGLVDVGDGREVEMEVPVYVKHRVTRLL